MRPALTEPIFGSTTSTSRTRARPHTGTRVGEDLRQLDRVDYIATARGRLAEFLRATVSGT